MAVRLSLPLAVYHGFLGRCKLDSRPYEILRNSIVDRAPGLQEKSAVHVLCSKEDANILLKHAIAHYPQAIPSMRNAAADVWDTHLESPTEPVTYYQETIDRSELKRRPRQK
jgi:hypothetical protein